MNKNRIYLTTNNKIKLTVAALINKIKITLHFRILKIQKTFNLKILNLNNQIRRVAIIIFII